MRPAVHAPLFADLDRSDPEQAQRRRSPPLDGLVIRGYVIDPRVSAGPWALFLGLPDLPAACERPGVPNPRGQK